MKENLGGLPSYYSNARPELTQLVDPTGLRVLEVGCAAGAMGAALLEKGACEVVNAQRIVAAFSEHRVVVE